MDNKTKTTPKANNPSPEEQAKIDAEAAAQKAAEEKEAKEAAKAAEKKLRMEIHSKVQAENAELKAKRQAEADKREYVPKKGTGKMFHVKMEQPVFNSKTGEKTSQAKTQIMDLPTFKAWLLNAARLGFAWKLVHDPSPFYTEEELKAPKAAWEEYNKKANADLIAFAKNKL